MVLVARPNKPPYLVRGVTARELRPPDDVMVTLKAEEVVVVMRMVVVLESMPVMECDSR